MSERECSSTRDVESSTRAASSRVQVESITLPKGMPLDAEIVRHPGSVVIVPVADDGSLMLVRQYRHAIGRYAWELPAGRLKPGEDARAGRGSRVPGGNRHDRRPPRGPRRLLPDARLLRRGDALLPRPRPADAGPATPRRTPTRTRTSRRGRFSRAMRGMIARGEIVDLKTIAGLALLPRD